MGTYSTFSNAHLSQEEQNYFASRCLLSTLIDDIKVEILKSVDIKTLHVLLVYLPNAEGSFHEIFSKYQRTITKSIMRNRFRHEWESIAERKAWKLDVVDTLPKQLEFNIKSLIISSQCPERAFFKALWPRKRMNEGFMEDLIESTKRTQEIDPQLELTLKSAMRGGLPLLYHLQTLQDHIEFMKTFFLKHWSKGPHTDSGPGPEWVCPLARQKLDRVLLILWRIYLHYAHRVLPFFTLMKQAQEDPDITKILNPLPEDEINAVIQFLKVDIAGWGVSDPETFIAVTLPLELPSSGEKKASFTL
ncbi:hypothetical protein AJ80_03501 [Polytolypa hystricis UAMH7299]|uniref:Uncharacterized protein n=1 Tax=Polytolypa hystricis (strain UAMH7299) TaxID=1447883 RepID=A0A2B7YI80_POLH7|nr:hypothetical protein AJ80_03501 [Polytolypa hystricis UAMH7299]